MSWDYEGPVTGIVLYPHENAEPLRLEFDKDLYIQEYIKTQFAGAPVHIAIIEYLRRIQPCFLTLHVTDEAEYWDTNDSDLLQAHLTQTQKTIGELMTQYSNAKMMVRTSDGRIIDIIHYDE